MRISDWSSDVCSSDLARIIVLAPHEREPCLIGYDQAYSARLYEKLDRRFGDDFGPARDDAARRQFGATEQLGYYDHGRIVLSPMSKDLRGLDRMTFCIPAGDTFGIGNANVLLEVMGACGPRMPRNVRSQHEAKKDKLGR